MEYRKMILLFIVIISAISCKNMKTKYHSTNKKLDYIPYYLKVYEADSLFYKNDYSQSFNLLDSLFTKYKPLNIEGYYEYEIYLHLLVHLNKREDYSKEIKKLIQDFGYKNEQIKNDSILNVALSKSAKLTKKEMANLEKEYIASLDLKFREQITKMNYLDQNVRKSYLIENKEVAMRKVDQKNDSIMKNYILKLGFPGVKKIGVYQISEKDTSDVALSILFNHFSYNGSYDFYKKELIKYIKNGECNPAIYASLIDRWHSINNDELFYYYRWHTEIKKLDSSQYPKINKRRISIGLPTIEQEQFWFKRLNINY